MRTFSVLLLVFLVVAAAQTPAQEPSYSQPGGQLAILIGVDQYRHAPPLQFAVSGSLRIAQTLRRYAGYRTADVLQLVDAAADPAFHPTRASLQAELPRWLSKAGAGDQVLIAFSGHAYRADDGQCYLAALDTNPADLPGTGLKVSWLRDQLAACPARAKLLLLDTRQRRPDQSADEAPGVSAAELAGSLQSLPGLTVLAASAAGQPSLIWPEQQQTLFAFWLAEALKGYADADRDGLVTSEELAGYVQRNVAAVAKQQFSADQQPQQLGLPPEDDQAAAVVRVQPQSLKRLLADLAEHLAIRMQLDQHHRLGVLEFTTATPAGEVLGSEFGVLGRYCGTELHQQLAARGTGQFEVADQRRMETALKELNFGTSQLGSESALKQLGAQAGQLPVVAVGTLTGREDRQLTMRCQLLRTDGSGVAGEVSGTARLNDSEWAMLGRSVNVEPADLAPPPDAPANAVPTQVSDVGELDQRSQTAHPLADQKFPLRVRVMVGDDERQGVFRDGDLLVPLRPGEVYRIEIENGTDQGVFLRLLVDGLNTLPERLAAKGINIEAAPGTGWAAAQPVNLAEAQAWWLDPPSGNQKSQVYEVRGVFSQVGQDAKYNAFRVVDAPESQAARLGFADQAGLITAAFYRAIPKPAGGGRGGLGTALGDEYQTQTDRYTGDRIPGPLQAVIHLRYVDAGTEP